MVERGSSNGMSVMNTSQANPVIADHPESAAPIFILGITGRSGTNFLWDLLCLHPDCESSRSITTEDYLVHHSDLLVEYAHAVHHQWKPNEPSQGVSQASVSQWLGESLVGLLSQQMVSKRLVSKTPSVHNLEHFFELFPQAYLLILVRDGRAVVESHVRSFGRSYEGAMLQWAEGARTILNFDRSAKPVDWKYMIVRYEDLWHNNQNELHKIFEFTGLDAKLYDFEAARNLPVRGSSELRHQAGELHWEPVEKTVQFDPLRRWRHWHQWRHARFNWLAGTYLQQFGYEPEPNIPAGPLFRLQNYVLDGLRWGANYVPVSLLHVMTRLLGLSKRV